MVNNNEIKDSIPINSLYWLSGGLVLSVLPHSQRIPFWVMPFFLALCVWKLFSLSKQDLKGKKYSSTKILVFVLLIIGVASIYIHFGTLLGRSAGVSLLVLLAGFKIFEIFYERDFYVTCFLGYFIVVTNFLYTQTIGTAIYMACTVLVMTLSLVSFNDSHNKLSSKTSGKFAATLLLQSIPVMLILFLLFPRISGPLWGMPKDARGGITGIDDKMTPGSISELILSNEVAFRVDFKSEQPEKSKLYWRGPVLLHTDRQTWTRIKSRQQDPDSFEILSDPVSYTVTLEPHNQKWLYALDIPGQQPSIDTNNVWITSDYQLLTNNPVSTRTRYSMVSYPEFKVKELTHDEFHASLQLPNKHKRTKALVQQWKNEGLTEQQIIDRALKLFAEDEFYYTLRPPVLDKDRVDEFLFETKQGFCEHYANAFAIMMRAAGIPTRIVLGYQGGENNPVGNYFIVHQRNAHAWTEVWIKNQGWTRIDPTAAVSPLRIIEGIESALPNDAFDVPLAFSQSGLAIKLWRRLNYQWDAINNQWNQWVISYGPKRQKEFLSNFGMQDIDWGDMLFLITGFVSLILVYIAFMMLKTTPSKRDPVKLLYDQFCKKLSHVGIQHFEHEGPLDFAKRASRKRNDLALQINNITNMYIATRYGSDISQLEELRKNIKAFST